ncbi:MAG: GNAT family N-acetyltransferase [Lachnospiraceae bacterium]|nr:GNAT family N-acetyltransferase [Lachnospiraceae bacterium]MDY5640349.1 GNAT family N-acetyltransferase [Lachnospiraceae bacterium]
MNDNILIRTINENEWEEAMNLAWDTFILYEAPEYTKEGITSFRNFVRDPILKTLFIEGKYNVLAAYNNNIIVGIIGVRNETHISLLFVDSEYHKKGIARRLVEKTFERTYEKYGKREMTVNSSPYAVGFYHKMGFVDTDIEQTTDGIRYTPMKARF